MYIMLSTQKDWDERRQEINEQLKDQLKRCEKDFPQWLVAEMKRSIALYESKFKKETDV